MMTENQAFTQKWWHKAYKALYFVFVIFVIIAIVELQPSADVPAPTIYGIALIIGVDALYYEWLIRKLTGKPGRSMVRRYFNS